jgi:hypothetical protein
LYCVTFELTTDGAVTTGLGDVDQVVVRLDDPPPVWVLTKCHAPVPPSGQLVPTKLLCRLAATATLAPTTVNEATTAKTAMALLIGLLLKVPCPTRARVLLPRSKNAVHSRRVEIRPDL